MPGRAVFVGLAVVWTACSATPEPSNADPTNVAARSVTPNPSVALAPVLDDRFGFIVLDSSIGPRPAVRRESVARPFFALSEGFEGGMAVAPDGRRIAYWTLGELHVLDLAVNAQPRTLLALATQSGERGHSVVWSSDGTGLVIGVDGPATHQAADSPPEYSALRVLDAAGGQPREIARLGPFTLVPLAWDRQARIVAAYEQGQAGAAGYVVIEDGGKLERGQLPPGPVVLEASRNAQQVQARGYPDNVMWVWPVASAARAIELRTATAEPILAAAWRPGTTEIGVLVGDRLELWDSSGARRPVPLPPLPPTSNPNRSLIFRPDGSAVFIGLVLDAVAARPDVYSVAVELASGRSAVLATDGVLPWVSVRIGP